MLLRRRGMREKDDKEGRREGEKVDGTLKYERRLTRAGRQAGRKAERTRERARACVCVCVRVHGKREKDIYMCARRNRRRRMEKARERKREKQVVDDVTRNRRAVGEEERANWDKTDAPQIRPRISELESSVVEIKSSGSGMRGRREEERRRNGKRMHGPAASGKSGTVLRLSTVQSTSRT